MWLFTTQFGLGRRELGAPSGGGAITSSKPGTCKGPVPSQPAAKVLPLPVPSTPCCRYTQNITTDFGLSVVQCSYCNEFMFILLGFTSTKPDWHDINISLVVSGAFCMQTILLTAKKMRQTIELRPLYDVIAKYLQSRNFLTSFYWSLGFRWNLHRN